MGVGGKYWVAMVASVRRCQGLLYSRHSWIQLAQMDPLQDISEPLRQDGGASKRTDLRRGKKLQR